jgi:hypothetical protein
MKLRTQIAKDTREEIVEWKSLGVDAFVSTLSQFHLPHRVTSRT